MKEYTVKVFEDGAKEWFLNGKRHREDGPAIEHANGSKFWYLDNNLHREDGPAIERPNGDKDWFLNDKRHREDGPAVEWADGGKQWFLNGQVHREDGPAIEWPNGTKQWYLRGQRHREDGPAIEWADGIKRWYLDGDEVTEEEHKRRTSGVTMDDALEAGDAVILREQAARIEALERQRGELLQALEILTERIGSDEWFAHWSKIAERAIAKAKGEEQ